MNLAYVSFGILAIVILLLITEWIPTWMTGLGISAVVILFGILPAFDVIKVYYSPIVLMVASIFILGEGLFRSGIADGVGMATANWASKRKDSEVIVLLAVMIMAALLSTILSNLGVAAAFTPVVITIARYTKISRTKLLLALAVASTMGGMITLSGSPPNLLVQAALVEAGYEGFGFFGLSFVGLPITILGIIFMATIGIKLVPSRYDEENDAESEEVKITEKKSNKFQKFLAVFLFFIMIIAIMFERQIGIRSGHIGMVLSAILIATRILTPKQAWKALNWKMTVFIVGMLILSSALTASGGSKILADSVVNFLGNDVGERTLIAILFIFASVLTQFLSNTALAGMLIPLVMPVAIGFGMNPVGAMITIAIAASSAFATSFGTPANLIVTVPGEIKFTDWLKVGIPLVLISLIICVVVIPIVYPAF